MSMTGSAAVVASAVMACSLCGEPRPLPQPAPLKRERFAVQLPTPARTRRPPCPDLKTPSGSATRTLTANTWWRRSSTLCTFRGVNSLTEAIWTTVPANRRPGWRRSSPRPPGRAAPCPARSPGRRPSPTGRRPAGRGRPAGSAARMSPGRTASTSTTAGSGALTTASASWASSSRTLGVQLGHAGRRLGHVLGPGRGLEQLRAGPWPGPARPRPRRCPPSAGRPRAWRAWPWRPRPGRSTAGRRPGWCRTGSRWTTPWGPGTARGPTRPWPARPRPGRPPAPCGPARSPRPATRP